jgi:hypothetical protein
MQRAPHQFLFGLAAPAHVPARDVHRRRLTLFVPDQMGERFEPSPLATGGANAGLDGDRIACGQEPGVEGRGRRQVIGVGEVGDVRADQPARVVAK